MESWQGLPLFNLDPCWSGAVAVDLGVSVTLSMLSRPGAPVKEYDSPRPFFPAESLGVVLAEGAGAQGEPHRTVSF